MSKHSGLCTHRGIQFLSQSPKEREKERGLDRLFSVFVFAKHTRCKVTCHTVSAVESANQNKAI